MVFKKRVRGEKRENDRQNEEICKKKEKNNENEEKKNRRIKLRQNSDGNKTGKNWS